MRVYQGGAYRTAHAPSTAPIINAAAVPVSTMGTESVSWSNAFIAVRYYMNNLVSVSCTKGPEARQAAGSANNDLDTGEVLQHHWIAKTVEVVFVFPRSLCLECFTRSIDIIVE